MRKKFLVALLLVAILASQSFAFNNDVKWQRDIQTFLSGGIAISGNNLFFGDVSGNFYAANKNTGSIIWTVSGNSVYGVEGSPAVTSNGNVVFTQSDGSVTCLKISDGSVVWNYAPNENENSNIIDGAAAGSGLVFMVKSDAKLYALNGSDGSVAWTYKASSQGLRTVPSYSDGIVFLGEYDGIFSMIDAKSGKRLNGGGAGGAVNTPVAANGNVYFSAWDGSVNAVQIKSVIPLWEIKVKDVITTPPALNDGIIAVGTGRGSVIALDAKGGEILWQYDTEAGEISANLLNGGGVILVGAGDGEILALDSKTGRLRNKLNTQGAIHNGVFDNSDGTFYFGSGSTVYAVD